MRNPSVRGERSPPTTSPPSPTCAVRPFSGEFRPDTLDTGVPPSLARRAASTVAPAHAAIVRDRPPRVLHPHARHDYRLWLIRLNRPRARSRTSPIRPSSYRDRSASPTLPAPPLCTLRLFSVLLHPPLEAPSRCAPCASTTGTSHPRPLRRAQASPCHIRDMTLLRSITRMRSTCAGRSPSPAPPHSPYPSSPPSSPHSRPPAWRLRLPRVSVPLRASTRPFIVSHTAPVAYHRARRE